MKPKVYPEGIEATEDDVEPSDPIMQEFPRAYPPEFEEAHLAALRDYGGRRRRALVMLFIRGFLTVSIPGFLVGIGVGWLIWG